MWFIFVGEVTDKILDASKKIVLEEDDRLSSTSLVESYARSDILERGGEGTAVYALHDNYRWRSANILETSPAFEK